MRRIVLAGLVAAASFTLPASSANAIYCGELQPVCKIVCDIKPPCIK